MSNKLNIISKEKLLKTVSDHNGTIEGEYINCRKRLIFHCSQNHSWEAEPRKIVEGHWCSECSIENNRTHNADFDFFNRETEAAFYWAGFIAADGWVRASTNNGYILGISLSIKDLNHLEKFKRDIKGTQQIKQFIRKEMFICNNKKITPAGQMCSFIINSKDIVKSLEKFGIIQAKTYHLYIPDWLKKHELVRHYLRGYIDGDGTFCIAKNKNQKPHVFFSLLGTANLLNSFIEIMKENGVGEKSRRLAEKRNGKKEPTFDCIKYGGNVVISRMYDYLYTDATVFLERKEEIAKKSKEWVVDGVINKRKDKSRIISKEDLLNMAKEHKSQLKIAEILGCTSANISFLTKLYKIRDEFNYIIKGYNVEDLKAAYVELNNFAAVGRKFGISRGSAKYFLDNHVK